MENLDIIDSINKLVEKNKMTVKEGYMNIADYASKYSSDPSTKVGAVVVGNDEVLSWGCNNTLPGFEEKINWNNRDIKNDWVNSKYPYILHAERDAIYKANRDLIDIKGASIYVNLFPCNECAIAIIASGIKKVYYCCDKYHDYDNTVAARSLFENCGVTLEQVEIELGKYI